MAIQENRVASRPKDIACRACGDTGWKINRRGQVETVERCECYRAKRKEQLLLKARIPERYMRCSLDNYYPQESSQQRAKEEVEQFIKEYPDVKTGLLFMGSCGVGKTHLALAAIRYLILEKGVPCLFYDFRDLIKELQSTYSRDSEYSELDILQPVLSKEVLVLDELGARMMSPWVRDILTHILIQRYNEKLITLITSNWMDAEYKGLEEETLEERIGYRLRSRLYEMCKTVVIQGPDYRLWKERRVYSAENNNVKRP